MSLTAGTKLGPYEILAPIGAGGMGEVYRARDPRLNRDVAIKVSASQFSTRFEREAQAIAALNHPHICQIYDVGPNYLVMEFIEGTPLRGPLPLDQALRYAAQICDALEAAHRKNITHRDLKPGNILVTASGVKLLDFGLAKVGNDNAPIDPDATAQTLGLTQPGTVLGTAAYMSPEQAKGTDTDARSDIFSLGLVLYEMLSGRRAFSRNSMIETLAAIVRDEPAPLDAPSNVNTIVTRCLCKSPANRFQTATEVREAIEQAAMKPAEILPSIAVLPFANMSADKENEYFSDGLAEEILNLLAKLSGLKVIARTSSFAFRGREQDIRKIAETLGVSHVLEGSVRKAGNRIRVTAQLIYAADGSHLWSERYDRELADVFAVQDEISGAIAEALGARFSPQVTARPRYVPKVSAYEAFLKAKYYQWKISPQALALAKEFYDQAIALDPNFALARVGQGDYFLLNTGVGLIPLKDGMTLVREHAQKALDIDPTLGEAHALLGIVAAIYDYDWKEAERRFQRAMELSPNSVQVRLWRYSFFLLPIGRSFEAVTEARCVLKQDPLNVRYHMFLAQCLFSAGEDSEGMDEISHALALDESYWLAWTGLALYHVRQGSPGEALPYAQRAYAAAPFYLQNLGILAGVLTRTGENKQAEELLQRLRSVKNERASSAFAIFYIVCGEIERAAMWLEKAVEERDFIGWMQLRRFFGRELSASINWRSIAKKLNLPESAL